MKKIQRIGKGEKVLVQMLSEDLQMVWDKLQDIQDDGARAQELNMEEGNSEETAKDCILKMMAATTAQMVFWKTIHDKYGHWGKPLAVRDGYALVTFDMKGKAKLFEKFMENIMGDDEPEDQGFTKGD